MRNALKAFVRAQQSGNIKTARTCERSRRSLALAASSYVSKWAETEESDAIQVGISRHQSQILSIHVGCRYEYG